MRWEYNRPVLSNPTNSTTWWVSYPIVSHPAICHVGSLRHPSFWHHLFEHNNNRGCFVPIRTESNRDTYSVILCSYNWYDIIQDCIGMYAMLYSVYTLLIHPSHISIRIYVQFTFGSIDIPTTYSRLTVSMNFEFVKNVTKQYSHHIPCHSIQLDQNRSF
jgi:hypothetical protein